MKKNIRIVSILFLCFSICNAYAQSPSWQWAKQFAGSGDDFGLSVITDASGNIYTTGYFTGTTDFDPGAGTFNLTSNGVDDIFISKLDASGNLIWVKSVGGGDYDEGYSVAVDATGNVYIAGSFGATVDFNPGAGNFNLTSAGMSDVFVLKLDASGNFLWAKKMGGNQSDFGIALALDATGNVYTTGWFDDTGDFDPGAGVFNLTAVGDFDIYVSKISSSGTFLWAKSMGGSLEQYVFSIAVDASGNVYTTGHFNGVADFDPSAGVFNLTAVSNTANIYISKLDASGNFVWAKAMGGTLDSQGYSLAVDATGNVYAAGHFTGTVDFDPGAGTYNLTTSSVWWDAFILKLSPAGNFLWAKATNGVDDEWCFSIALDLNNNAYITGMFNGTVDFDPGPGVYNLSPTPGHYSMYVAKYDIAGNFVWAKSTAGTGNAEVQGRSLVINPSGNAYITGYFSNSPATFGSTSLVNADASGSTSDIFIAKLNTTTGINEQFNLHANKMECFPNPATNELNVIDNQVSDEAPIIITDISGKVWTTPILSKTILNSNNTEYKIDINALAIGIYFVKIKDKNAMFEKQ